MFFYPYICIENEYRVRFGKGPLWKQASGAFMTFLYLPSPKSDNSLPQPEGKPIYLILNTMKKNLKTFCYAAVIAVGALLLTACSRNRNPLTDFAEDMELIPVKTTQDGRWSMANEKGEIVYSEEFTNEPTVAYHGLFVVEEGEGYTLYKTGGAKPEAVKGCEGLKAAGYMEDGLIPVTFPNSRITLVNAEGKKQFELSPIDGKEVVRSAVAFTYGRLAVETEDGKQGYVDTKGKVVIKPKYDEAKAFSEDVAVVGTAVADSASKDQKMLYAVIDKDGKELFKLKENYSLVSNIFVYGYLLVQDDNDHYLLLNHQGEATKLPSRIHEIYGYNDKFILYNNEDGDAGVCDPKGEVVIRAKYASIGFGADNKFYAQKDKDSKEISLLDAKGEVVQTLDYEAMQYMGSKFGTLAKDGKVVIMLDKNLKQKGKEEYYEVGLKQNLCSVKSDYYDPQAVVNAVANMVTDKDVAGFTFGTLAQTVLKGTEPEDYAGKSFAELTRKEGYQYTITAIGIFSENIVKFDYNGQSRKWGYQWQTTARLKTVAFNITTEKDFGEQGYKLLKDTFKKKGFALVKEGHHSYEDAEITILKKGKIAVGINYDNDSKNTIVAAGDATDKETMDGLMSAFGE